MARFEVIAGRHASRTGMHKVGDVFETKSEKEAEFCRKYPDKFREVSTPVFEGRRGARNTVPHVDKDNTKKGNRGESEDRLREFAEEDAGPTIHEVEGHKDSGKGDEEEFSQDDDNGADEDTETVEVDLGKVEKMTLPELKKFVNEYGIDVKNAKTKEDYVKAIKKNVEG